MLHAMLLEDSGQIQASEAERAGPWPFQELADQFPGDGRFPYRMAIVGNNLAALLEVQGRGLDEAEKIYRHNLDYWKAMVAREPAIQDHRSKLALTLDNLASVLAKTGSKPEAEQYLRSAVHLRSALTEYFPQGPHHHNKLAEALEGLAQLVRDRGDLGETRRIHERTDATRRTALALAPGNSEQRRWLAACQATFVETLIRSNEHADASKTVQEFVALVPDSATECYRGGAFLRGAYRWRRPTRVLTPTVARTSPGPTPTGPSSCFASH